MTWCLLTVLLSASFPTILIAQNCNPPQRPFVPADPRNVREYGELIGRDFETYIGHIQSYLRCLEEERARAFEEAREVTEEYGRFLQILEG